MKEKKKRLPVLILLLLVGLTSGYIANTYAKYASEINGNTGTATVAKWDFTGDNEEQTITISLDNTPHASTLIGGKIAPGTSGSFNIALKNKTTETGVDFTIKLKDINNIPTNLKFYKDAAYTTELTPGSGTITGQLKAKDPTGLSVPIYWRWELGTSNEVGDTINTADTTDGKAANSLTIGVDITGVQTAPGAEITSHIN